MIERYITSFVEGRVRLRHPALCSGNNEASLRAVLGLLPGIHNVVINPRTSSLLLEYDPAQLSREQLTGMAESWLATMPSDPAVDVTPPRTLRALFPDGTKCANRAMLASLGTSMVLGAAGRTGAHVVTGGLFLALVLAHIYCYRKCL